MSRGRGGKPPISVLVFNEFTNDSRVLQTAQSLAADGHEVTVIGVVVHGEPRDDVQDGVRVARMPFDPLYHRLWESRAGFLRPWRHVGEIAAMLRQRNTSGGRRSKSPWVLLLLATPWFVVTAGYHGLASLAKRLRRAAGMRSKGASGQSLEQRYKEFLFLAPHAVRVATWSRMVLGAYEDGSLPVAAVWHANDLETLPVALLLRRRLGGHVVYDSHEIYLEMPGPKKMGPKRRALLAGIERVMAQHADAVVTINEPIAQELERRWGIDRPVVIRNLPRRWSPPPGFKSPLHDALAERGITRSRRVLLAHGNFQMGRGIEALLAAAQHIDDLALVFLGRGILAETIAAAGARPEWAGRLLILPMVPPSDVLAWIAGADFSACLIEPTSLNHRLSSPNKLFQAIAAGVPVLASNVEPIREVVERYQVGVTCDPTDLNAIAAGLRALLDLPVVEYERLRSNARRAHLEELNWEREAARLLAVYERLAPAASRQNGRARR